MKFTLLFVSASLLMLGSCSKNYSCNCTTVTITPEYENICPAGNNLGTVPESSTSTTSAKYVNEKNSRDAESSCSEFSQTTFTMFNGSDSITEVLTCTR